MIHWRLALLAIAGCSFSSPSLSADAGEWLQRIYRAGERHSYAGTFVYQQGGRTETSRIIHVVDGGQVRERLEALDGPPREIVRDGDEIRCYSPATMTLRVERGGAGPGFPERVLGQPQELAEHYRISKAGTERIAGHDCQVIVLEPRDSLRYGHKLWADIATGLLVKAQTLNERNEVVDQFQFTELSMGPHVDRSLLATRMSGEGHGWRVERVDIAPGSLSAQGWTLRALPPGYRKYADLKRVLPGNAPVSHVVLSDGLAAVSIFVEPIGGRGVPLQPGMSRQGPFNVFVRKVDDFAVTVVGEAPAESVRAIAQAVEYRRPPH